MTVCSTTVCGVGGSGTLPDDPENNSILTATPAFGGIDVTWTYPSVNFAAVAHFRLYRSQVTNPLVMPAFELAPLHAIVNSTQFYDKVDQHIQYAYWIQVVSVHGTVMAPIGPASAAAKPPIATMIEQLAGQINSTQLATALRSELDQISTLNTNLLNEVTARENGQVTLAQAIAAADTKAASALNFIHTESNSRVSADGAMAEQINLVATTADGKLASASQTLQTNIDLVDGKAVKLEAQYTVKTDANGHIAGFGLANTSATDDGTNTSLFLVKADRFAIAHPSNRWKPSTQYALGKFVHPTASSSGLIFEATAISDGDLDGIPGESAATEPVWPTTVGTTVTDGEVTWTARNPNTRVPFIVDNGVVYMSEAAIKQLTFDKLRASDGSLIVQNGRVLATYLNVKGLVVEDPGKKTSFSIDANGNAFFAGNITGSTGRFNGSLAAGVLQSANMDSISYSYPNAGSFSQTAPSQADMDARGWTSISVRVTLLGGGGGGGGAYGTTAPNTDRGAAGGGGGAGQYLVYEVNNVTPGGTLSIEVGGGGGGGAPSTHWGGSSGASTPGGTGSTGAPSRIWVPTSGGTVHHSANGGAGGVGGSASYADQGGPILDADGVWSYPGIVPGGSIGGGLGSAGYTGNQGWDTKGGNGGSSQSGSGGLGGLQGEASAGGTGAGGGGGCANTMVYSPTPHGVRWGASGGTGLVILDFFDPNMVVTNKRYSRLITWLDNNVKYVNDTAAR